MDNPNQEVLQQTPVQPEIQPQQPSNSNWLKTLSIGLGVIGIGLTIGIAGYLLGTNKTQPAQISPKPISKPISISPTAVSPNDISDQTATWKTYTNTKLSYSFKYPIDWSNCPSNFGRGQSDDAIYFCSASLQPFDYIWTSFMDNPQNLSFQQLATQGLPSDIKDSFKYTTVTMGKNIAYVTRDLPGAKESEEVFFKMPSNGYAHIAYQPSNSASGFLETYSSYKIFQQILSTFKFTN